MSSNRQRSAKALKAFEQITTLSEHIVTRLLAEYNAIVDGDDGGDGDDTPASVPVQDTFVARANDLIAYWESFTYHMGLEDRRHQDNDKCDAQVCVCYGYARSHDVHGEGSHGIHRMWDHISLLKQTARESTQDAMPDRCWLSTRQQARFFGEAYAHRKQQERLDRIQQVRVQRRENKRLQRIQRVEQQLQHIIEAEQDQCERDVLDENYISSMLGAAS